MCVYSQVRRVDELHILLMFCQAFCFYCKILCAPPQGVRTHRP